MILIINSSPRKKATHFVTNQAKSKLEENSINVNIQQVREKEINFCKHCDYCFENEECIIKDDMKEINSLLEKSEGVILSTPVYNSGINSQLQAVLDRTRSLLARNKDALKGKIGAGIAVGGDRMGGQEIALSQIHNFYILNGMIPVSGGAFGANLGATYWSKDTKKGVKEDKEGQKSLNKTLNRFMEYLDKYGKY